MHGVDTLCHTHCTHLVAVIRLPHISLCRSRHVSKVGPVILAALLVLLVVLLVAMLVLAAVLAAVFAAVFGVLLGLLCCSLRLLSAALLLRTCR